MTPNVYAGGTLNRAAHLRRDDAWIAAAWASQAARVAPLWRGQCLITADAEHAASGQAALLPVTASAAEHPWALLGLDPQIEAPIFTVDLSALESPAALLPPGTAFADLRPATAALPMDQAALLAYARALLDWRRRARFCGVCGAPCRPEQAGHVSTCTACQTQHFPRTDPTVIMLVTHAGRALLAHNARFPTRRMYSTLAGFVEPGESLEEAVARETLEETGVRIAHATYHSSQPWPYPTNLMLGFHAEATTEAITVDPHELLDARWFTPAELANPEAHGFELPPPMSIARRLIQDWLG
jgi:NAD+ diphosphatase